MKPEGTGKRNIALREGFFRDSRAVDGLSIDTCLQNIELSNKEKREWIGNESLTRKYN